MYSEINAEANLKFQLQRNNKNGDKNEIAVS